LRENLAAELKLPASAIEQLNDVKTINPDGTGAKSR
jgi:hypothetical protein